MPSFDDNPYEPPTAVDPEASSGSGWRLLGLTLVAKHGTTLPKVDIETGISSGRLVLVQRKSGKRGNNAVVIQEYTTPRTLFKRRCRKTFSLASKIFPAILAIVVLDPFELMGLHPDIVVLVVKSAIYSVVVLAIFRFFIRKKLKSSNGLHDTIYIGPIHPNAYRFLMKVAKKERG